MVTWTEQELSLLADLWPTVVPDCQLERIFRRHRGAIHRKARQDLGLKCRVQARADAANVYLAMMAQQGQPATFRRRASERALA